jgi:transposase
MAKNGLKEIRRTTRRKFSAEEKIRIVLEGLRGEIPISDVCRRRRWRHPHWPCWLSRR